jgi:hypothetical protein
MFIKDHLSKPPLAVLAGGQGKGEECRHQGRANLAEHSRREALRRLLAISAALGFITQTEKGFVLTKLFSFVRRAVGDQNSRRLIGLVSLGEYHTCFKIGLGSLALHC